MANNVIPIRKEFPFKNYSRYLVNLSRFYDRLKVNEYATDYLLAELDLEKCDVADYMEQQQHLYVMKDFVKSMLNKQIIEESRGYYKITQCNGQLYLPKSLKKQFYSNMFSEKKDEFEPDQNFLKIMVQHSKENHVIRHENMLYMVDKKIPKTFIEVWFIKLVLGLNKTMLLDQHDSHLWVVIDSKNQI